MTEEEKLILELIEFCDYHDLPSWSADELLAGATDSNIKEFLEDYIVRWNKSEEIRILTNYYNNQVCKNINFRW
jgi:hypothetical protein